MRICSNLCCRVRAQDVWLRHTRPMTNRSDTISSVAPFLHALMGTVLLAIGGMLFVNLNEDPEIFMVFTIVFTAPGLYLLIAGAVARGLALARG